jgi:hypothetical protein
MAGQHCDGKAEHHHKYALLQLPPLINRTTSNSTIQSAEHVDRHKHG